MKKILNCLTIIVVVFVIVNCHSPSPSDPVKIAISKAVPEADYHNYFRWLKSVDSTIIFYEMYHLDLDSALTVLRECDGLLLTGGTDIYPGRFGKENDTSRILEPDLRRDELEFALLSLAVERKMPVQGVCRGLQLINVFFGGSLIIDIPSDLDSFVQHQLPGTYDCPHEINIKEGSLLFVMAGIKTGATNSNHHQGIDVLAPALICNATTNDGLIEAIGMKDKVNTSYLFAVQWHPERMDYDNPLSGSIAQRFVSEVKAYANQKKHE